MSIPIALDCVSTQASKYYRFFFTCCLCTPLLNHVGLHAKVVFHFLTCLVSFLYQLIRLCSLLYLLHLYIASKISSLLLFSPPLAHFLDPPLPILIRITKILFLCQHIYSEPLNKIQILFTKVKHLFHSDLQGFIVPTHLCSFNFSYHFIFLSNIVFLFSTQIHITNLFCNFNHQIQLSNHTYNTSLSIANTVRPNLSFIIKFYLANHKYSLVSVYRSLYISLGSQRSTMSCVLNTNSCSSFS